jgi:hypothetical protein
MRRGALRWWSQGFITMLLSGLLPGAMAENPCIALNGNPTQGGCALGGG